MITLLAQAQDLTAVEARFISLVDQALQNRWAGVVAVAAAVAVGAVHALTPGHGKAIAAAYLVGGRGTRRDALLLGVIVAAMHSASVLAMGLALHLLVGGARDAAALARVTPWLRVVSGIAVLGLGVWLLVGQWRRRDDHGHHHLPPEVSPFSRRGLLILGMAGGILPSPAAFLVLITAWFTGRTGLGLALVAAFSVGLAATLTVVGLVAVRGREVLLRRMEAPRRMLRALAVGGAAAILLGGVILTVSGVLRL